MAIKYDSGIADYLDKLAKIEPLPLAFESKNLEIVFETISIAFEKTCQRNSASIKLMDEDKITESLEIALNESLIVDSVFSRVVASISRDSSVRNSSGISTVLKPDLHINMKKETYPIPLIVEAKIINNVINHHKVDCYYREGIFRFANGNYAWYHKEAAMIAYVRDNSTINSCLTPYLKSKNYTVVSYPEFVPGYLGKGELATAVHRRPGRIKVQNKSVGPIKLWHLWMSVNSPKAAK